MHFPKHWGLAKRGGVLAWGWSDVSLADALSEGEKRLDRIIAALRENRVNDLGSYGYPDRPMREEVLHGFVDGEGQTTGAVSRNSSGCLVLNTAKAMFVDVDEPRPGATGFLAKLFRKKEEPFEAKVASQAETWIATHPGWGWRVYRTRAGMRLLATHREILPEDEACAEAFRVFQADELYQTLCANQKCFRARLTPKPWRCGMERPAQRWPWRNAEVEAEFKKWEEEYRSTITSYAACRLVGQFGAIHPALRELVEIHDKATGAESGKELA